jgi:hypothetical protein
MLKSYLKKQKEEAGKGKTKVPSKDKPENSDSDSDDMDFKNLKVADKEVPRRRSLDESKLSGGAPVSPGAPPGAGRQRRQSFDGGSNTAMVNDAMKDVDKVLGAVAEPKARPRRGSIH